MEQIKILHRNEGRFPFSEPRVGQSFFDERYGGTLTFPFVLSESMEFYALRKIDPFAADKLKKQLDKESVALGETEK